jgi:hypothetical protein
MMACKNSKMRKSGVYTFVYAMLIVLLLTSPGLAAGDIIVPEDTKIALQLNINLSTKHNKEGDPFTAVVVEPVNQADRIAIPKGSVVSGSISRITRPGVIKGKAVMNLLFQSISIPGRGEHPISAVLEKINSEENSGSHPEGTVKGEGSTKSDITKVLMPSLVGAGIGGLSGGGRAAAIGGGIGAAVGLGAVLMTRGQDLELSRGSPLSISLEKPLIIPADTDGAAARNR